MNSKIEYNLIEKSFREQAFTSQEVSPETLAHAAEFLQKQYDHLAKEFSELRAKQTKHSRWVQKFKDDLKSLRSFADADFFGD